MEETNRKLLMETLVQVRLESIQATTFVKAIDPALFADVSLVEHPVLLGARRSQKLATISLSIAIGVGSSLVASAIWNALSKEQRDQPGIVIQINNVVIIDATTPIHFERLNQALLEHWPSR